MNSQKIKNILTERREPVFRLKQIERAVFFEGRENFDEIVQLPEELRNGLQEEAGGIYSFAIAKTEKSRDGFSVKTLLVLRDGRKIESVLISPKPGIWTTCISVQVGCPLNCRFCATGKMGLERNLTGEEISDQVLWWKNYCRKNSLGTGLTNVVVMGMGEPFLNYDNLKLALKTIVDPALLGMGARRISVSTAGIPEGFEKFSQDFPQMNLALYLHFAEQKKREKYMPIGKKYGLTELKKTLEHYLAKTKRKVFLEYLMLKGVNDQEADLNKLVEFVRSSSAKHLLCVNLIIYHSAGGEFESSSREVVQKAKNFLEQRGANVTVRKSLGEDIQGACGQLAYKR